VPVDTVELYFEGATVQYKMGMNRIEATSTNPNAKLFIGYMGTMISTVDVANFSYSSALTIDGEQIAFLRGEMTVVASGDILHRKKPAKNLFLPTDMVNYFH
jgi:hypothetical protein